jgi:P pilus assembly chaperone PapD
MAKKNSIISVSNDNGELTFTVANAGEFVVSLSALSEDVRARAMVHGIVQKISDAAAIAKADLPVDPTDAAKTKLEAMQSVATRLLEGDWSKRAGEGAGPVAGIIFRAFAEWATAKATAAKKTITEAELRAVYDAKDRAGQLALRNVPEIAAIIERMKSERGATAAKAVDSAALLGELGL